MDVTALTYCPAAVIEEGLAVTLASVEGLELRAFVNRDDIVPRLSLVSHSDSDDVISTRGAPADRR